MCDINIRSFFGESNKTQIIFEFTDAEYELAPEKLAEKWTQKVVVQFETVQNYSNFQHNFFHHFFKSP